MLNISPDIVAFLHGNHIAVLATASQPGATPHAAVVFYTTDSHMNLYFLTKTDTTKSKNLETNPQAALVVFDARMLQTAQIMGRAAKVESPQMMQKAQQLMAKFSKNTAGTEATPISKLDAGGYVLYCLTPQSIRLGDYKYGAGNTIFDVATPSEESLEG